MCARHAACSEDRIRIHSPHFALAWWPRIPPYHQAPPRTNGNWGTNAMTQCYLGRRCQFCNHAQLSLSADCPRTGLLYIRKGRMHARHLTRMRCAPKIYQTPTYNLSLLPRKQVHEQAQPGMSKSNSYSSAGRRLAYFRFLSRANHGS